jgi:hypothetical protein
MWQRDRVFQQVENPNNNSEWTDVSINCHYVGTFEVGEEAKVDKAEVGGLSPPLSLSRARSFSLPHLVTPNWPLLFLGVTLSPTHLDL